MSKGSEFLSLFRSPIGPHSPKVRTDILDKVIVWGFDLEEFLFILVITVINKFLPELEASPFVLMFVPFPESPEKMNLVPLAQLCPRV
jgi:hypothetical protein